MDAKCTGTGHYRFYHYAVGHLQTLPARDQKTPEAKALAQEELIKMGPVTRDERVTIGIFLLSLLAGVHRNGLARMRRLSRFPASV